MSRRRRDSAPTGPHTWGPREPAELVRPGDPALSFAERFGLLVERRWSAREEGRLARRLERAVFLDLAELSFLGGAGNVILTGATGLGKTYLACALADRAARRGHSVL